MLVPFAPPPGLFSDDTTFASPGNWETGSNVRFRLGKPQVIGGWVDALSGSTLTGVCRNTFSWNNSNGTKQIAFGTHTRLQVWTGGALYNITPAGLIDGSIDSSGGGPGYGSGTYSSGTWSNPATTYYSRTWAFASYGDTLIANPRGGTIYQWTGDTAVAATAVTNAPAVVTSCLVTPERQLLAFGCNEEVSGNYNPLCIRGSDIEDITDWTTTATNNAFEHILEGGGRIVAARIVGAYIAVWTDQGLHLGEFIGEPGQAYRFDLIAGGCGLLAPNAVAVDDQTAFWIGSDYQFRTWTLGGVPAILECPIHTDFKDNLDTAQVEKVHGTAVSQHGEVWFFYPDTRDAADATRFVAYSFKESALAQRPVWFKGQLARTASMDAGAFSYPLFTTYGGVAYYHENGATAAGGDLVWHLTSADTYIDEGGRAMLVRGVVPDFEARDASVDLTLYVRRYPMSAATTKGPFAISTSAVKKDFRASGQLIAAKWSGTAYTRLGKPMFDVVPVGRR